MASVAVGFIGYGEVGKIFSRALQLQGLSSVSAYDIQAAAMADATDAGVQVCDTPAILCAQADCIFSAVTAGNTLAAAESVALYLRPGTYFIDLNSASPGVKRQAAACIEAAGGRYVEVGVMTSVPPYGIRVPLLLGGPHAATIEPVLQGWGMQARVASLEWGVASATKMCRSIMIKGLEALVLESFTTARYYGVEDAMIATLCETFPSIDWHEQGAYFFSRVALHGKRRAEEMREVAQTVREAGLAPDMASATAEKDDWMAAHARAGHLTEVGRGASWQVYADALLAHEAKPRND